MEDTRWMHMNSARASMRFPRLLRRSGMAHEGNGSGEACSPPGQREDPGARAPHCPAILSTNSWITSTGHVTLSACHS
jgi:hypothetical protein